MGSRDMSLFLVTTWEYFQDILYPEGVLDKQDSDNPAWIDTLKQ